MLIKELATIAKPISNLNWLYYDHAQLWDQIIEDAIKQIKKPNTFYPNLHASNWILPIRVDTRACVIAIGVMLAQNPMRKLYQHVSYASCMLMQTKNYYST